MVVNYAQKFDNKVDERFTKEALSTGIINQDFDFTGVDTVKCILFLHLKWTTTQQAVSIVTVQRMNSVTLSNNGVEERPLIYIHYW